MMATQELSKVELPRFESTIDRMREASASIDAICKKQERDMEHELSVMKLVVAVGAALLIGGIVGAALQNGAVAQAYGWTKWLTSTEVTRAQAVEDYCKRQSVRPDQCDRSLALFQLGQVAAVSDVLSSRVAE